MTKSITIVFTNGKTKVIPDCKGYVYDQSIGMFICNMKYNHTIHIPKENVLLIGEKIK